MDGYLEQCRGRGLAEVAKRAGISPPRVSQIQTEIERVKLAEPFKSLIDYYKVKA